MCAGSARAARAVQIIFDAFIKPISPVVWDDEAFGKVCVQIRRIFAVAKLLDALALHHAVSHDLHSCHKLWPTTPLIVSVCLELGASLTDLQSFGTSHAHGPTPRLGGQEAALVLWPAQQKRRPPQLEEAGRGSPHRHQMHRSDTPQ